jgi:hypothetical protein
MATFTLDTNTPSRAFQFQSELAKITTLGTFDGCQLITEYFEAATGRWLIVPQGGVATAAVTDLLFQSPTNRLRIRIHNADGVLADIDVTIVATQIDTGLDYAS